MPDAHDCTGNTLAAIGLAKVFSVCGLRLHLLAEGQRFTLPNQRRLLPWLSRQLGLVGQLPGPRLLVRG